MLSNLDAICTHNSTIPTMSYFVAISTAVISLTTIPANILILVSIIKFQHLMHRSFYVIIANIALADLVCGIVTGPMSCNYHIREALQVRISTWQVQALHFTFFTTNGVSVTSMTVLSIDRLGILLNPFSYYQTFTKNRILAILVLTWFLSAALATIYLSIGYIRYLAIFAVTTGLVTVLVITTTMALFKFRMRQSENYENETKKTGGVNAVKMTTKRENIQRQTLHNFTRMDKGVTTMFLWMLCLFLLNYMPAIFITIYMNVCMDCRCSFVHVMRDVVFLSILSSGLWRAINFLAQLTLLRQAVKTILGQKDEKSSFESTLC